MTTASGSFAINFAAIGDTNPYTNSNLTYVGTGRGKVLSGVYRWASGAASRTAQVYNGSVSGNLASKIEFATAAGSGDSIAAIICDTTGAGYAAVVNSATSISLIRISALAQADVLGSYAPSLVSGDVVELRLNQTTHALTVHINNGSAVASATDSTVTASLAPGYMAIADNTGNATIRSFALDGSATAATLSTPTPSGTLATATTATIGATTDQASGTAYTILSTVQTDVTTATDANVIAGQKAGGATTINNNAAVSSTTISIPITGLTAGTTYYASTIQVNSNGNSTRANTSFTTAAAAPSSACDFDCASTGVAATTFAADAGASRVVVAVLSHEQTNGTRPVASLVVGGATFQKLTDAIFGQGTSYAYTELWYCLESSIASIGANPSVTVTATSTGNKVVSGTLFTIANVQQSAASWVQGVDAKAIGTDLSATLATVIGRQIVGGATATIGGNAFTTGASVTEITGSDRNFNSSASRAVSFYGVASGTSTTVTTGNTNSNTAMSQSMVAVAFPALSGRSIGITLRDAGAVGQPVLNNQTRKFWTRSTLDGAVVDGGSTGISITCGTDGVFILSGLTIAAGAGYLTMADPADPSKSHNFFVTYV